MRLIVPKTVNEIHAHYEHKKLGYIKCPNGSKTKFNLQHVLTPVFEKLGPQMVRSMIAFGSAVRYPRTITKYKSGLLGWSVTPVQELEQIKKVNDFDFALIIDDSLPNTRGLINCAMFGKKGYLDLRESTPKIDVAAHTVKIPGDYGGEWDDIVHGTSQIFFMKQSELEQHKSDINNKVAQSILSEGVLLFGEDITGMRHRREMRWEAPDRKTQELGGGIYDAPVTTCPKCTNETMDLVKYCPVCGVAI